METASGTSILAPNDFLVARIKSQQPRSQAAKPLPTFYHNIEEALDVRRDTRSLYTIVQNHWQTSDAVDFCSGDILSLNSSGALRNQFLAELAQHSEFSIGSGGVRLMDGNYPYLEQVEQEIAAFHGAEAGLIVGSAFEANVAVWTALPRPGDVLVYDALVHASTLEGMKQSLALEQVEFCHNSVESFRNVLLETLEKHILIRKRKRSILVAVESIYSMDGDVCPLEELIEVAEEISQGRGNIQFVVDEAHSVGVIGSNGSGLVCQLGLEKEIAVVVHSYGKALGATGAIVLGNRTIKSTLANFGKSVIFTTSPSFPFVAAIRSGYSLLRTARMQDARERIQSHARTFYEALASHPSWPKAQEKGLLRVPLLDSWEDRAFLTHIVTVSTRQKYTYWLYVHLMAASFCVFPVEHPIVPAGQGRLRIIFHASNTDEQITAMVDAMLAWVDEMLEIEERKTEYTDSSVARQIHDWMRSEGLRGAY
ncbi:5-aminolevulinate synthase [Phaeosphaeriaceae sp. PMI808]|nr:5-aminolevulinate synthase [Phaeosphaeriaceae sp. PMI808]